jgi:hypothetical protein
VGLALPEAMEEIQDLIQFIHLEAVLVQHLQLERQGVRAVVLMGTRMELILAALVMPVLILRQRVIMAVLDILTMSALQILVAAAVLERLAGLLQLTKVAMELSD